MSLSLQRRATWCPGAALAKAPLASAAAVQARLQRVNYSPSQDSEEILKDQFRSILEEGEEIRSKQLRAKRVGFVTPQAKRYVLEK